MSQDDGMQRLLCHLAPAQNTPLWGVTSRSGHKDSPGRVLQAPVPVGVTPLLLHEVRVTANVPSAYGAQGTGFQTWVNFCSQVAAAAGCPALQW